MIAYIGLNEKPYAVFFESPFAAAYFCDNKSNHLINLKLTVERVGGLGHGEDGVYYFVNNYLTLRAFWVMNKHLINI